MIAPELAALTITAQLPLGRALHHDRAIPQIDTRDLKEAKALRDVLSGHS